MLNIFIKDSGFFIKKRAFFGILLLMNVNTTLFFSNRVEALYENMRDSMFSKEGTTPFARRLLVVPSRAIKSWLMLRLADDIGIAAGIEYAFLSDGIDTIKKRCFAGDNEKISKISSSLEIALRLETEIKDVIKSYDDMTQEDRALWAPLLDYIGDVHEKTSKVENRVIEISNHLSLLFEKYGLYAGTMVEEWEKGEYHDWQQALWRRIFSGDDAWSYPYREDKKYEDSEVSSGDMQVHLFGFSFIPSVYKRFFDSLGDDLPVYHYALSPCCFFWGDTRSDRESRGIRRYWKKRDVSEGQTEELEEYLRDTNPLLANFGKLGREFFAVAGEGDNVVEEYRLPRDVMKYEQYSDIVHPDIYEEDPPEVTMLKALQADMLLMRNSKDKDPIKFDAYDKTVQVHKASSRMREVQVLYNNILDIIGTREDDDIFPSDVIVMAPDIGDYIPYIDAVFGSEDSLLPFNVSDAKSGGQRCLIEAFSSLLRLATGRWESSAIVQLFDFPSFRMKHNISGRDIETLRQWIDTMNIRWGKDGKHRQEVIAREHRKKTMTEEGDTATWEEGLGRLMEKLAMVEVHDGIPVIDVELSDAPFIGKMSSLISSFDDDLTPLADGTTMTIKDWAEYLRCLAEEYLTIDSTDKKAVADGERLFSAFNTIEKAGNAVAEELFTFSTVLKHLDIILSKQDVDVRDKSCSAVTFCSMFPMRAVPSKVICLIGMDEESYPRRDDRNSLDNMASYEDADYMPTRADFDRYLFLENILSARDVLYMSYYGDDEDGKGSPSILVSEVVDFLDKAYNIADNVFSETFLIKHPLQQYHRSYFDKNNTLAKNYSFKDYNVCEAKNDPEKDGPHHFVREIFCEDEKIKSQGENTTGAHTISIDDLLGIAKNPVRAYFNKTLGIYLEDDERSCDSEFEVSHLGKYIIKKDMVLEGAGKGFGTAKLPLGAFRDVATQELEDDIITMRKNMEAFDADAVMSVELDARCHKAVREDRDRWRVPAIKIDIEGTAISIVGTIKDVTSRGVLYYGKSNKENIIKIWPALLAMQYISKNYSIPVGSDALFLYTGDAKALHVEDPEITMKEYIRYYWRCMECCCPLIPQWVPDAATGDAKALQKKIQGFLVSYGKTYRDKYITKILCKEDLPDAEKIVSSWHKPVAMAFEGFLGKKGGGR